jgi:hypothetical protein
MNIQETLPKMPLIVLAMAEKMRIEAEKVAKFNPNSEQYNKQDKKQNTTL